MCIRDSLGGMAKFTLVGGGILASLAAWIVTKLDSPMGKAFGIAATVLVGVMFAVLGQVYQTPAMIHTPFVFWAILTLPFALASRSLAHWTVWITILVVAIGTYANSGLRLAGNDLGANVLNVVVSAGFMGALILVDKVLAPRMAWTRAEWFRVLLVLGAIIFAFAGFTESLWGRGGGNLLWVIVLAMVMGFMAYLNYLKPSLASLSLATFGGFTLIAQFGPKLLQKSTGSVDGLFILFVWFGALTVGMVALFGHYSRRLKAAPKEVDAEDKTEDKIDKVQTSDFSNHMGIDNNLVTESMQSAESDQPWYMHLFLAIAGILTAIMGCAFSGFFIALFWTSASGHLYGILGAIVFGLAIILRRLSLIHI